MIECPKDFMDELRNMPGEIDLYYDLIGVAGGIQGHTDLDFPPWSAFLVVHNDGCRVWQAGGYRGVPKIGERFELCIHRRHGVTARRVGAAFVALHADGQTREEAIAKLAQIEAGSLAEAA